MNTRKLLVAALGLTALVGGLSTANAEPARRAPAVSTVQVHDAKAHDVRTHAVKVRHVSFSHKRLAERRRVAMKRESHGARLAQARTVRKDAGTVHHIG